MENALLHNVPQSDSRISQDQSSLSGRAQQPKRVLLVDDEPAIRECLSSILSYEGYTVDAVPSCLDALLHFIRTPYHCLIVDLSFPEGNGVFLYQQVNRLDPELARRIIFITGLDECRFLFQQARDTSLPVLRKPISTPSLIEIIDGYSEGDGSHPDHPGTPPPTG